MNTLTFFEIQVVLFGLHVGVFFLIFLDVCSYLYLNVFKLEFLKFMGSWR